METLTQAVISGTTLSLLPLPTAWPKGDNCNMMYRRVPELQQIAWDPDYARSWDSDLRTCLPPEMTSWWYQKHDITSGIALGPTFACPEAYSAVQTVLVEPDIQQIFCCPSSYTLHNAQPILPITESPTQCMSVAKVGEVLSFYKPKDGVISTTVKKSDETILGIPINGFNIRATTPPDEDSDEDPDKDSDKDSGGGSTGGSDKGSSDKGSEGDSNSDSDRSTGKDSVGDSEGIPDGGSSGDSQGASDDGSGSGKKSVAVPVGASIGGVLGALGLGLGAWFLWRRRRARQGPQVLGELEEPSEAYDVKKAPLEMYAVEGPVELGSRPVHGGAPVELGSRPVRMPVELASVEVHELYGETR